MQAVLFTLEMLQPVKQGVIDPFTNSLALVSGYLMGVFDSGIAVDGIYISSLRKAFTLRIEAGCNGVEPMIIFTAAVVAFQASVKAKLMGIVIGFFGIQIINILRIISLFYIGEWSLKAYEWAHLYVCQALILLDAFVLWVIWVRQLDRYEIQKA